MRHLFLFIAAMGLAGCATQAPVQVDPVVASIPASLHVPPKQMVAAKALFEGGLIYTCSNLAPKGMPAIFDWEETGSQGALTFEDGGYGRYEGQAFTWRLEQSTPHGVLVRSWMGNARTDAPWGLYKTIGAAGNNVLAQVNWIQRIGTQGGAIPTVACNEKFLGTRHAVKANAYFIFWKDLA